ncbi:hypothetical protein CcaverHIS002_0703710 [Cutaneotrichosporon cavernicola]|uniref:Uncharacterized protein n=1 Tax=Cutaneotrichosporon cavernicola TaxID=279322 RepID=A0AA48LAD8_9TREE|nr:uncharacterized protein CcaverHIS019_0703790 [Cutaneotrichosporon cavernicola]BEI87025.1 hypothetical protein CcaverHIS002_0703710 [Cutaneotrichosporon cavernicola]BEI94798.1 hypothetical protein CcaverHIS019_0703790 [Cutaneotrichosporon cavernicola]BEJ02573.1 hypothetical protein CcaverHIS631_0703680 [Cutaneotrichosporon cavernicola]BEJ10329.1 hypothetical protein CcaverHIS641_0703640 [Cutaneotrichosporon cavernicola]
MAHYLRIISRPEMREYAALRTRNVQLEEENARLRINQGVCTDHERGEIRAYRQANDELMETNLSLQIKIQTLNDKVESLSGTHTIEQFEALRSALAEANQRAQRMDFQLMDKEREMASLQGELKVYRQQAGIYYTRVGELTRMRPGLDDRFNEIDLNAVENAGTTDANNKPSNGHTINSKPKVPRDSIFVTKQRLPNQSDDTKNSRPNIVMESQPLKKPVRSILGPLEGTPSPTRKLVPRQNTPTKVRLRSTPPTPDKENQYNHLIKPLYLNREVSASPSPPPRNPKPKMPNTPTTVIDSLDLPALEATDSIFDYTWTTEDSTDGVLRGKDSSTSF